MLAAVVEPHADRVDAVGRALVVAELDVGGRIAELAAALVAVLDHRLRPRTGGSAGGSRCRGRRRRAPRGSGSTRPARRRAATAATVSAAMPCAAPSSRSTSALPPRPWPKVKSSPVTTPAAPIRVGQQARRRNPRRWSRRASASKSNTSIASAPAWANSALALVEAGQPERRRVGLEVAHRMRVEGGDDHRPPLVRAARDRAADHRLVAEVEAVEIAERDDRSAQARRERAVSRVRRCMSRAGLSGSVGCKSRRLTRRGAKSYLALIPFHRYTRRRIRARVGFVVVEAGSSRRDGVRVPRRPVELRRE